MADSQFRFQCKHCREVWLLPHQTHVKTSPNRLNPPTDILVASFYCSVCGSLFDYTPEQLPQVTLRTQGRGQPLDTTILLCILFRCGQRNCEIPIGVHIVAGSALTPKEIRTAFFRRSLSKCCPANHPPIVLNEQSAPITTSGDLVWQMIQKKKLEA